MAAAGTNTAIAKQIEDYNSAILRREKLLENSSERSPVIQDLDNLLAAVRRSIISSLDSNISVSYTHLVLPLHSILPITGISSMPFSSTVRIWSACEFAALETLVPVSEL